MHTPVCDALGLNAEVLGEQAARLPAVSMQLRHNRVVDTLRYIHPESREGCYLKDLFEASNKDFRARYGVSAEVLFSVSTHS